MTAIVIPEEYNYIGAFLTFRCNMSCPYCINNYTGSRPKYKEIGGVEWVRGLNRIVTRPDLPVTLQGGEPTVHRDFYYIINGLKPELPIDILTNGRFNVRKFMEEVRPDRVRRVAPYASIRVSYHQSQDELVPFIQKVKRLQDAGYHIGVFIVDHPASSSMNRVIQETMRGEGIDCRLKEFLGEWNGKLYGTYAYSHGMNGFPKKVQCASSEMLIAPDGSIHRCHSTVYRNQYGYSHILDNNAKLRVKHWECQEYGMCQPCDTKIKTNRHQIFGHCAVRIKEGK